MSVPIEFRVLHEFRVAGLQRSGNHAILNWLMAQCLGNAILFNDIKSESDPFYSMEEYLEFRAGRKRKQINFWQEEHLRPKRMADLRLYLESEFPVIENMICSFEDLPLTRVARSQNLRSGSMEGCSEGVVTDLLVIRDPFNLFASRYKIWNSLSGIKDKKTLIEIWKEYAREALGVTSTLNERKVVVNFNNWFSSVSYRERLSQKLGLEFSDRGLNDISSVGVNSSFDGVVYQGRAQEMRVLERWKHFENDESFRQFFQDPELLTLSDELFGEITGTPEWLGRSIPSHAKR